MVTCGHQFHTGDESDWLISSSATCPIDGNTTAAKILRKLIRKHCKKFPNELDEIKIETDKEILSFKKINQNKENDPDLDDNKKIKSDFNFYSQPDNNHYAISQFLQDHYRNLTDEGSDDNDSPTDSFLQSKPIQLTTSKEREMKLKNHRENRIKYNKEISAFYDFGDFDETQHLDGCPVKWLYRKKSMESLENLRNGKWSVKKQSSVDEKKEKTGKAKNFRDRTPVEMKIRKMKLKKRNSFDESRSPVNTNKNTSRFERNYSMESNVEVHKKKLAAKLNWRPFADNQDEENSDVSERSSRDGFLPPRPLLGLRPLLSILLSPRLDSPCCSVTDHLAQNSRHNEKRSQSASLSIKSLDLPTLPDSKKPRPRTIKSPKCNNSKPSKFPKKLQTPTQITIKLRHAPRKSPKQINEDVKSNDSAPSTATKKSAEKIGKVLKHSQSLTSLCYELGNKSNTENRKNDYFEQMIRELATEDKDLKIKRFLNSSHKMLERSQSTNKRQGEKKKIVQESQSSSIGDQDEEDDQFQIICSKVQFFERPGKPMK